MERFLFYRPRNPRTTPLGKLAETHYERLRCAWFEVDAGHLAHGDVESRSVVRVLRHACSGVGVIEQRESLARSAAAAKVGPDFLQDAGHGCSA